MKTIIYSVGYDESFIKMANTGWGCGYIMIPLDHPFLTAMNNLLTGDDYMDWGYCQIPEFEEEITLDESDELNGVKYRRLGFDMAHSHNNMSNSSRDIVICQTIKMQSIVESYNKQSPNK
jgi:hypothetical protein